MKNFVTKARIPTIRKTAKKTALGILLAVLLTNMFAIARNSQTAASETKMLASNNTESEDFVVQTESSILSTTTDDWPMLHHDLSHTGYSTSKAPNSYWRAWTFNVGYSVQSSPAVDEGKIYFGANDKKIYCLNAANGNHIWNRTTGGSVYSSPAVSDAKVYVGSADNKVYCLDASTGAHIWNFTTGYYVYSSPAVTNGKVYIGSWDWKVYCLNAATGIHIWNRTINGPVSSSPAVVSDRVYVGAGGKVNCLNAQTGAYIWNYTVGDYVSDSLSVDSGKVYVGSRFDTPDVGKIYCLNALTGAHIWNRTIAESVSSTPAIANGKVYIGSYEAHPGGKLYCLNAATGAHIWNFTTTYGSYGVTAGPSIADNKVYAGASPEGRFYCLDASTGEELWQYYTFGSIGSSPAIASEKVYVGSGDGIVYAFGPQKYAILAAPLRDSDSTSMQNDMKSRIHKMRLVLLENGWTDKYIIYLTRNDTALQAPNEYWVDGDATSENIQKAFNAIAYSATTRFRLQDGTLGPEIILKNVEPDDFVFIYLSDHGGQQTDTHNDETDGKEGTFCSYEWNDRKFNKAYYWDDTEINASLSLPGIRWCRYQVLVVDACHSGEFIGDCQGTGRIITSACTSDDVAWQNSYPFPDAFTHIADADANKDGRVSIEEAHQYAVLKTHLLYSDQDPEIADGIAGQLLLS